jgi:histidine triad (HIT) family protein
MCTISDIINKKVKSNIVYEDDFFIGFLDIHPLFIGHCLLAPKIHCETMYDLPLQQGIALLQATRIVANAVTKAMKSFSNNAQRLLLKTI